jgi:hypothetical protein
VKPHTRRSGRSISFGHRDAIGATGFRALTVAVSLALGPLGISAAVPSMPAFSVALDAALAQAPRESRRPPGRPPARMAKG